MTVRCLFNASGSHVTNFGRILISGLDTFRRSVSVFSVRVAKHPVEDIVGEWETFDSSFSSPDLYFLFLRVR